MTIRTTNTDWDWKFGHGKSDYANRSLAIAYSIKMKILSWYGDCFFAVQEGIDWKNLLGQKGTKNEIDSEIKRIIATEEGVTEISYFDSSLENRDYHLTARIKTIYNETIEVRV